MLESLEPKKVFKFFEEISMIPHGSGNLNMIVSYLIDFAKKRNLEYFVDKMQNVIIKKKGNDSKDIIILQGHTDMVCVKEDDSNKDLLKDHIDIIVDGDWVKANKTSLGADDGIAVAMMLAILDETENEFPTIEALFTSNEETGMYGAYSIDEKLLNGKKLINIDSEEEGIFTVSCAGGTRVETVISGKKENVIGDSYRLRLHNLLGGHSGILIHKNHANANIELIRCIYNMIENGFDVRLVEINGGKFDNVISDDSICDIVLTNKTDEDLVKFIKKFEIMLKNEYSSSDKNITLDIEKNDNNYAFTKEDTKNIVSLIYSLPNGLIEMSQDFNDLPQTSLNLGIIITEKNVVKMVHLVRSSIDSRKEYINNKIKNIVSLHGGVCIDKNTYPAWQYNKDSILQNKFISVYKEMYGNMPKINATHGGLECGIFVGKIDGLEAISIGPTIKYVHSVNEKLNIKSVERVYNFLLEVLKK